MIKQSLSFYLIGILFLAQTISGQDYSISNIPEKLKENAYAVVRQDNTDCEVLTNNSLRVKNVFAITIFNKSGDFLNSFEEYYDNYEKITEAKVVFYNSMGKKVNSYKMKDFDDYSAINGFSLFEESRVLTFSPNINSYPYTVEYTSTSIQKEYISIFYWFPVSYQHVSVQSSSLKLSTPEDYPLNYKLFNLNDDFKVEIEDEKKIYTISLQNYPAIEDEPYSPSWKTYYPHARIVPINFEREEYKGSYASWKDFGKWVYDLKADRDDLSPELEQNLIKKFGGIKNQEEKILALYKHLQSSTRYVNISYGIGGYQPYSAMTVYENGYGDCKALSNYMYSMLKIFGIESFYTLIYAGSSKNEIITDFPSQQFNHVILCVPNMEDTIWLECTSQTIPPGYLSSSTSDRTVLLIDEQGGRIARSKKYELEENLQLRKAIVDINSTSLELNSKINTTYKGQRYSTVHRIINESTEDQKNHLLKTIDIPQFSIRDFSVNKEFKNLDPVGIIDLDLKIENYIIKNGDRFFLPLNLMNKYHSVPKKVSDRKRDVVVSNSYHAIDSIFFQLPENFLIDYLPDLVEIKEVFGEYKFHCKHVDNKIQVVREIKIQKGTYPKEFYSKYVNFIKEIIKSDRSKALLRSEV